MLGSLILYLKGMRRMMFQLSGFYYRCQAARQRWKGDLDLGFRVIAFRICWLPACIGLMVWELNAKSAMSLLAGRGHNR